MSILSLLELANLLDISDKLPMMLALPLEDIQGLTIAWINKAQISVGLVIQIPYECDHVSSRGNVTPDEFLALLSH
jgi:hypothetical protein